MRSLIDKTIGTKTDKYHIVGCENLVGHDVNDKGCKMDNKLFELEVVAKCK